MNHPHGGLDAAGTSTLALVLRLALLLTTAFVAGAGLVPAPARKVPIFASALAALLVGASVVTQDVGLIGAVIHVALVVAVPLLQGKPATRWVAAALVLLLVVETSVGDSGIWFVLNTVFVAASVAWLGLAVFRPDDRKLVLSLGIVLAVAGAARLVTSGIAFDRRIYETLLGLVLLAIVLVPLATLVVRNRIAAAGVAVALVAWGALPAIATPPDLPVAGVPVLTDVRLDDRSVPVLVSPHRPGRNLVHFPASAGKDLRVNDVPAVPIAGAEGTWAEVDLPPGRSTLVINDSARVEVDPGDRSGPSVDPECAGAALGALLDNRRSVLTECPSQRLSTEDSDALVKLVGFLKARGVPGITLATDGSPRSTAAEKVIRSSGLRVDTEERPDNALVAVSGWTSAYEALTRAAARQSEAPVYAHGLYLAPWLLHAPIATAITSASVPLRFDPREQLAVGYAIAVGNRFGGENPTPAGFHAWLGDRKPSGAVQIFAVAQVSVMPNETTHSMSEELAGQWIPQATVVPVSAVL
ncbi:hypothetical protein Lesp02_32170 [Lentzea sp. NBRC 105346]|uniref:hypothetical protein n=1 Tax=Lentzea sp. NBRC 105346 TaxID=3032205 RepID=UPI0024A28DD1|nr:hypothetical protein [Lentzea sp. NBRC 105346]GLZ31028.1 hypothetical protein Lesp02_32170 [Lentzea sp. NBRC 105346]